MLLKDSWKTTEIVYYLVSMIGRINSSAKARIIRLIIDFIDYFKTVGRETFRRLVGTFTSEKTAVKFQIIQLGVTLMQIKFEDERENLNKIFTYALQLGLSDADYGLKLFWRMVKGIFDKKSLWGKEITFKNAFYFDNIDQFNLNNRDDKATNEVHTNNEYNEIVLPSQTIQSNILDSIDEIYLPSLSSLLNLQTGPRNSLKIEQCSEEHQQIANEYISKSGPTKEIMFTRSVHSEEGKSSSKPKSKANESIGKIVFIIL